MCSDYLLHLDNAGGQMKIHQRASHIAPQGHRATISPYTSRGPVTAQAKRNRLMRLGRMMEVMG